MTSLTAHTLHQLGTDLGMPYLQHGSIVQMMVQLVADGDILNHKGVDKLSAAVLKELFRGRTESLPEKVAFDLLNQSVRKSAVNTLFKQ